jgi:hypothetical protein
MVIHREAASPEGFGEVIMDQEIRNRLRSVVTQSRRLLEDAILQELEGKYGIFARKETVTADPKAKMLHLSQEEQEARKDILDHYAHIQARSFKPKEALDQLVREVAFTHLNRLCAYKMMEAREVYVGGQRFRESVSRGVNSNGVKFYLAEHEEDERLFNTGQQDIAYRHYLDWLGGQLSEEIGVLFNPNDPANRLYPRQKTLDEVLELLNNGGIKSEEAELREQWPQIWSQDETIGWVYQYFTPKELRDQARNESQAPRNSYELAFRNQFFTPRYVVEFLTDNTLGRAWYEMGKGDTKLKDQCRYMIRRPNEKFLKEGEDPPKDAGEGRDNLSQEELLKLPVYIPHRPKKDPRELKILDPACGSGHFLLYCFDLLLTIYEEAYADSDLGPALKKDYSTLDALKRDVPRLILAHNLHGIDIDLRASQIAALALWLRCQRAYQEMGLKKDRPQITRSNFVCAEPMPGEEQMLNDFVGQLEPKVLGQVVEVVFDKMKLAGEAGSLLKIEEEIRDAIGEAKRQYAMGGISIQRTLFDKRSEPANKVFSVKDISDSQFFESAETQVIEALRSYAEKAHYGQRLQRRLFSDDAVRGFAFVDILQKKYDFVLMNPPFGMVSEGAKSYVFSTFAREKIELGGCFITRFRQRLTAGGSIGIIANRTMLFSTSFGDWRDEQLSTLSECADLGHGVLDALVETAAFTVGTHTSLDTLFFKLLDSHDKSADLHTSLRSFSDRVFCRKISGFDAIYGKPFAYWLPVEVTKRVGQWRTAKDAGIVSRSGLQTCDNFRFLRLVWEISADTNVQDRAWLRLTKGGEYQPFWGDVPLVVKWANDGEEIKTYIESLYDQWSKQIPSVSLYGRPGATYSERTTSGMSLRVLPAGCLFDKKGPFIGFDKTPFSQATILAFLAATFTSPVRALIESAVGLREATESGSPARDYLPSLIERLPFPDMCGVESIALASTECVLAHKRIQSSNEPNSLWANPISFTSATSLKELGRSYQKWLGASLKAIYRNFTGVENELNKAMELDDSSLVGLREMAGTSWLSFTSSTDGVDRERLLHLLSLDDDSLVDAVADISGKSASILKKSFVGNRRVELLATALQRSPYAILTLLEGLALDGGFIERLAQDVVSIAVGCCYGRVDVRMIMDATLIPLSTDVFAELPFHFPIQLVGPDGLAAMPGRIASEEWLKNRVSNNHNQGGSGDEKDIAASYPCEVKWDGILVDDAFHEADLARRVSDVFEIIWGTHANVVEQEAVKLLGVKELRDYFRKPGKGGFWDDHISRYSKSRRNAPIYWLLQSAKKNYSLWLYYHRLDKDLLFKALLNYVEPKIRLETSRLESLRTQKAVAGESGKEAKRFAKDVERQEDFLSELRDFEDKLRRAANLHLEPDLNDGVVLNIAPLWELVPWKEAKKYWDELMDGQYEWSSIGKQLRQKGLVK